MSAYGSRQVHGAHGQYCGGLATLDSDFALLYLYRCKAFARGDTPTLATTHVEAELKYAAWQVAMLLLKLDVET